MASTTKKKEAPEETARPDERSVRIKPYHPRSGHVIQRYTYRGIKFLEGAGWYTVPLAVAVYLKTVRNDFDDPHSPKVFTVCTIEEAQRMTETEYQEKVNAGRARPGDSPVVMPRDTSDQIRAGVDPAPVKDADLTTADLRRKEIEPSADRRTRPA